MMKKDSPRCPKCHSSDIYIRAWRTLWKEKSNIWRYDDKNIEKFKRWSKKYICRQCKFEFDVPIKFG